MSRLPSIAQAVAQLRKRHGWTLRELSERTGISISHLSAIENGKRPHPSFQNMVQLAAAFGVPLHYFAECVEKAEPTSAQPGESAPDAAPAGQQPSGQHAYGQPQLVRESHVIQRMERLYDPDTIQFILSESAPSYVSFARQLRELQQDVPQLLRRIAEFMERGQREA